MIKKSYNPEHVHDVADEYIDQMVKGVLISVKDLQTWADVAVIEEAIRKGNPVLIEKFINWGDFNTALNKTFDKTMKEIMDKTGAQTLFEMGIGMRFDLNNPYAKKYAVDHAAELVTWVSDESRSAINKAIVRAFDEGIPPEVIARDIRQWIGLTERQMIAVQNYWAEVAGEGWRSAKTASKMADTYAKRLIRYRARNIARTETIDAANHGVLTSWQQARDVGYVDPMAKKEWIAASFSGRTCEHCLTMDGMKVSIDEQFYSPTLDIYVDCPTLHPSCRCSIGLVTEID